MSHSEHGNHREIIEGRFAGVGRSTPQVPERVEMPPPFDPVKGVMRVVPVSAPSGKFDVRPAIVFPGEVTPIGTHLQTKETTMQDRKRTPVVTVFSGLATFAGLRTRG